MKKVGVFMGSFNPPHIGHVSVIAAAIDNGGLDEIIVVPAYHNVWKDKPVSFMARYSMCELAFNFVNYEVKVSNAELWIAKRNAEYAEKGIPSFEVLRYIKAEKGTTSRLVIITTPETFLSIPKWSNAEEILDNEFLIVTTPKQDIDDVLAINCGSRTVINAPTIQMSSTAVRNRIIEGRNIYPYVCRDVEDYLNSHPSLYAMSNTSKYNYK